MLALLPARPAAAQDAFEIQVYDAETARPGVAGFELHASNAIQGVRTGSDGELPSHHVTHLTIEPHIGIASWCEVGAYFQTALRPDGDLDFAGVKARFKIRIPRRLAGGLFGLSLNQEISLIPAAYEAARWGSEIRPIVDLRWRRFYASANPIVSTALAGASAGHPEFEPAAKIAVRAGEAVALGAEYYAALGPVEDPRPGSQQVHRLFAVVDLDGSIGGRAFDVNLGAGRGFAAGERWIVKAIVALDVGR
jgi:hypothetical protein